MPHFGAHLSIAGGLTKALDRAAELGCTALQIFTKNASRWRAKPLTGEQADAFRRGLRRSAVKPTAAHDSYLINVASPDVDLRRRSIEALVDELRRADALGLRFLVMHPGAHMGDGVGAGVARIAAALDEAHDRCGGCGTRLLLETTAGQGTTIGHEFEHLAAILDRAKSADRVGVCFDTCHVFAAGYPLWPAEDYHATFSRFGKLVGMRKLRLFHVNDSRKPLGSRVDRHAGLGLGHIDIGAFGLLVNDPRFARHPMVLETPKEDEAGRDMDPVNLGVLRGLVS